VSSTYPNTDIHPTAIVHPEAMLAEGVSIGPYTIVEPHARIGSGTTIASHARIGAYTTIGASCQIHHGAVVGTIPQDLKFRGEHSTLEIGDRTIIREFATLNRGTKAHGKTVVGTDTLIMAYVHVAHDCVIGNHVILSNVTQLGGHVKIEDHVISGGLVAVHQFVRIGMHAMISGGSKVSKDICPYIKVARDPLKPVGLNTIGLRRRGFSPRALLALKRAYRILFRSSLNISQAVEVIEKEMNNTPELDRLLTFIKESAQRSQGKGRGLLA
jgi:UDP-N-acetylglucosamine acyltransferase